MADYTYDPAGDAEKIRRRRLVAAQMRQLAFRPYDALIDAGPMKVANWGDAIASMAQAIAARREDRSIDAEEDANKRAQQGYENDQLSQYERLRSPKVVGQDTRALDEQGEGAVPQTVSIPGDQRRALAMAMASRVPALAKRAEMDLKSQEELRKFPGASVASRVAASEANDPSLLRSDVKQTVIGDQAFPTTDEGISTRPSIDARPRFVDIAAPPGTNKGQAWQRKEGTNEIVARGTGPQVVNNVDTKGQNAFEVATMGDWQKRLATNKDRVVEIANQQPLMREALQLVPQSETGFGADFILGARRFAEKFGISPDEANKIGSSQTLLATLAPKILDTLKALRPASNTDLEWSQKANVATLASDPRALTRAIQVIIASNANEVNQAQADFNTFTADKPDLAATAGLYKLPGVGFNEKDDGIVAGPDGRFRPQLSMADLAKQGAPAAAPAVPKGPEQLSGPAGPAEMKPPDWSQEKWLEYQAWKKRKGVQ